MGMGVGEYSMFPNGNIPVASFVKMDTTHAAGGYVIQAAAATDNIYGIAGMETHSMSIVIQGNDIDDGYAGVAGGPAIKIYGKDATNVPLRIGGTVTVGDRLTSDSSGRGITTTSSGNRVGAIARASGVLDDIIPVDVVMFDY